MSSFVKILNSNYIYRTTILNKGFYGRKFWWKYYLPNTFYYSIIGFNVDSFIVIFLTILNPKKNRALLMISNKLVKGQLLQYD